MLFALRKSGMVCVSDFIGKPASVSLCMMIAQMGSSTQWLANGSQFMSRKQVTPSTGVAARLIPPPSIRDHPFKV